MPVAVRMGIVGPKIDFLALHLRFQRPVLLSHELLGQRDPKDPLNAPTPRNDVARRLSRNSNTAIDPMAERSPEFHTPQSVGSSLPYREAPSLRCSRRIQNRQPANTPSVKAQKMQNGNVVITIPGFFGGGTCTASIAHTKEANPMLTKAIVNATLMARREACLTPMPAQM